MDVAMLRFILVFVVLSLSACNSKQKTATPETNTAEPQENITTEQSTAELAPHSTLTTQKTRELTVDNCATTEPLYLTDRVNDLNTLSQQMFALDYVKGVNGYANFLTLAQLALASNEHSANLVEQLGLVGITEEEQWFNMFCYLENKTPTNGLSINVAEDWLIRDDFYKTLTQKFQANFSSRAINIEHDLWRLSFENTWSITQQLTVDEETTAYVNFQQTPESPSLTAYALAITDTIHATNNELGDYFSITNSSDYTLHIIMPTFAQYPHVKNNIVDVLNGFKALEKTSQNGLYLPYFSPDENNDSFITFSAWLSENLVSDLLDDENQNYSNISQHETLKLLNTANTNSFTFNAEGLITSQYQNTITAESLLFVGESFNINDIVITQGNVNIQECEEEGEATTTWRPYFIVIEHTESNLIYTIVSSSMPEIQRQESICVPIM